MMMRQLGALIAILCGVYGLNLVAIEYQSESILHTTCVDGMPERDTVLWNTMINGLVKKCFYEDSIEVFRDMVAQGVQLDSFNVTTVLPAEQFARHFAQNFSSQDK